MQLGAMILSCAPLLRQRVRHFVFVVNFIDGHTPISEIKNLIIQIRIGVSLRTHDLLNALITPARPVVGRDQNFGLSPESVKSLIDLFRPLQCISNQCAAQGVDIVYGSRNILSRPEYFLLRKPGIHLCRCFGARCILKHQSHAIDYMFLIVIFDD